MARYSQYPQQKVDEALLAYYTLGTYEKASEASGVPWQTIADWITNRHTARYDELVEKHGPTLERRLIAKLARTADKATAVTDLGLEATMAAVATGDAKNAQAFSNTAKNGALVLGIVTDKKLTLEGRPTHITEHRDLDDILKSLNTLVPGLVIEGTAQEDHAPQLQAPSSAAGSDSGAQRSQAETNARGLQSA